MEAAIGPVALPGAHRSCILEAGKRTGLFSYTHAAWSLDPMSAREPLVNTFSFRPAVQINNGKLMNSNPEQVNQPEASHLPQAGNSEARLNDSMLVCPAVMQGRGCVVLFSWGRIRELLLAMADKFFPGRGRGEGCSHCNPV